MYIKLDDEIINVQKVYTNPTSVEFTLDSGNADELKSKFSKVNILMVYNDNDIPIYGYKGLRLENITVFADETIVISLTILPDMETRIKELFETTETQVEKTSVDMV